MSDVSKKQAARPKQKLASGTENKNGESKTDLALSQFNEWVKSSEIKNLHVLSAGLKKSRALFANTIAKQKGAELHHVLLADLKGKYIGETEKNLEKLFYQAEKLSWILFFDEADALFGKRTSVKDAHDKFSNEEVSYLLRKIQLHPGLILVGVDVKTNLDERLCKIFHLCVEV